MRELGRTCVPDLGQRLGLMLASRTLKRCRSENECTVGPPEVVVVWGFRHYHHRRLRLRLLPGTLRYTSTISLYLTIHKHHCLLACSWGSFIITSLSSDSAVQCSAVHMVQGNCTQGRRKSKTAALSHQSKAVARPLSVTAARAPLSPPLGPSSPVANPSPLHNGVVHFSQLGSGLPLLLR